MGTFDHLARCSDMTIEDAEAACASREAFAALLDRLGRIAAPNTGAASVLIAFARLASNACEWIDGDLVVELLDVDDSTEIGVMTELGAGMRERLFPPVRLRAPLSELTAALGAKPGLVGALTVHRRTWRRVTLGVSERIRVSSRPPRISDASLTAVRAPLVQQLPPKRQPTEETSIDAGWDDPDGSGSA